MLPDALQLRVRKRNSDFQKPWFSKETNLSGEKGTAATQHEFESRGSECFCYWKRPRLRGIVSPGSALSRRRSVSQTTTGTRDHRWFAADALTAGGSGRTSLSGRSRVLVSGPLTLGKLISIRTRLRGTDVL